jgi:hypothetical protein
MPAAQKVEYEGFLVEARPAFAWRRWTRFPLYFQACKPSFEIRITKQTSEPPREQPLKFNITFANGNYVSFLIDPASLGQGETLSYKTDGILLAPTGDASVRLSMGMTQWYTLYAFFVSHETALVFIILNVMLAAIATAIVGFLIRV